MARTEDLVARRGGPAVFLGRWIGFPRAVVPAAAGAVGMRGTVLLAWNAVGGGLWATVVVAGFCAGASWPAVQRRFGTGALIAGVGAVVLVVVVVLLRRRARTTSRRLDPGEPRSARRRPDRALLGGLGLGMILAVAFGELSDNVADHTPSPPKSRPALSWTPAHRSPVATAGAQVISAVADTTVMAGLALVVAAGLAWRRRWPQAALVVVATGGAGALVEVLKLTLARPRPPWSTSSRWRGWTRCSLRLLAGAAP